MKLSRQLVLSLICLISYFQLGFVVDSTTFNCQNNKIKVEPTSEIFEVILVDREKVIDIAKEHGLDSALNILGYNSGGCQIGLYDRNLLNDLFALVPGSNPSESILCFLNEYYLYPEFDKERFKTIYTDYLNSWIKNDSSIPLDPYAFETCLSIMLDYGDAEMQYLINSCFRYWSKRANSYKNQIDMTNEESRYYYDYIYAEACEKVYLSQYVLKKLKSTYFNAKEFDYYSTIMTVDYEIPNMSLHLFTNFSPPNYGMEDEKLKIKKSLNSLNDLFLLSLTELCTLFDLKKFDTCNNHVTIFVNKNRGLILNIADCDEEECFKCHQYGTINSIELNNKNSINLGFVSSWN